VPHERFPETFTRQELRPVNWLIVSQSLFPLLAQAAPASKPAGPAPSFLEQLAQNPMILIIVVFLVFMLMMGSGKRKQEKQRRALLNQIKRGDRVQTIGGIIGKVVEAEKDRILLKVDESSNTKIWFSRSAIHRVLDEEKTAESKSGS